MTYFKKLIGEDCYLSPVDSSAAEKVGKWSNDLEISIRTGDISDMISYNQQKKYLENMNNETNYGFFIIRHTDDEVVGIARLIKVDLINKKAMMGMFIGEKNNRNKGIGTEATRLLLDFGFNVLNLNNILVVTYSFNDSAIRTLKKVGFKEIGRRRKSIVYGKNTYDEIFMDILSDEFKDSKIDNILNGIK